MIALSEGTMGKWSSRGFFYLLLTLKLLGGGGQAQGLTQGREKSERGDPERHFLGGFFQQDHDQVSRLARKLEIETKDHGIDRVFLFGDSLSDTKNIWKKTGGLIPPAPLYWQGRFSNGPTWVEYFGQSLGVSIHNFAEAGARVHGQNHFYILPKILEYFWVDEVETQLDGFRAEGWIPRPSDLFVVWIGGNDHLLFPGHHELDQIVGKITTFVEALKHLGARKVMVMNLPDVSASPFHGLGIGNFLMSPAGIRRLVTAHNQALKKDLEQLRRDNPELDLIEIDMHGIIHKLISNARQYEFDETRFPCVGGPLMALGHGSWNPGELIASLPLGLCPKPEGYFFWDPWHPSTKVHCLAAANVLSMMEQSHLFRGLAGKIHLESAEKSCF